MSRLGKSTETKSRLVIGRGCGGGHWGMPANRYEVSLGDNESVLELDCGDSYAIL